MEGHRVTLPNNEIKDVIKVIKSLGKRRILLKGTIQKGYKSKKRIPQKCSWSINENRFSVNENVLMLLAKTVLIPLG